MLQRRANRREHPGGVRAGACPGVAPREPRRRVALGRGIAVRLACLALLGLMPGAPLASTGPASSSHLVTGMVVRVEPDRKRVIVSHDAVPGVMAEMTMPFEVRRAQELDGLEPGVLVRFVLVLDGRSAWAERVEIVRYESVEQDPLRARRLSLLETIGSTRPRPVAVGDLVPDFTLVDQDRRSVTLSKLRGKVVALNFIYTSCALPQFCYRVSNHFGAVLKRFARDAGRGLVMLTVTFDPARDTPEALAAYAEQWKPAPGTWHFLTGGVAEVQRVSGSFGVDFFPDEGLMSHSVRTAVIDRRGRLVANIEGNTYTASQLGNLVQSVLRR